jgi:hypothetical protein
MCRFEVVLLFLRLREIPASSIYLDSFYMQSYSESAVIGGAAVVGSHSLLRKLMIRFQPRDDRRLSLQLGDQGAAPAYARNCRDAHK